MSNIREIINKLRSLDLDSIPYTMLHSIMQEMYGMPIPAPQLCYDKGVSIIRVRPIIETDVIDCKEDLSYVPPHLNKKFQRASTPEQTMFYGVIYSDESSIMGCLNEACPCLREKNPSNGIYHAILSLWQTSEPISLFSIINPKPYYNRADNLKELSKGLDEFVEQCEGIFTKEDIFCLQEYMYEEFNKKATTENQYWITATFSMDVTKPSMIDGVLYESAQINDEKLHNVLCVAMKPESINKKLTFIHAHECAIQIQDNQAKIRMKPTILNLR